jgi:hypothetical protein
VKEQWKQHFSNVSWEDFENETVKRQLRILSVLGISALEEAELSEVSDHCMLAHTSHTEILRLLERSV